jgi:hypothetical protein
MLRARFWTTGFMCFFILACGKDAQDHSPVVAKENGSTLEARTILQQARAKAEAIQDQNRKPFVLMDIAIAQAKAGDVAEALKTADAIQEDPASKYSAKASALHGIGTAQAGAGDFRGALQTAHAIPKVSLDSREGAPVPLQTAAQSPIAFHDIAVAQADAGDTNSALQTATLINEGFYRVPALVHIATIQCKSEKEAAKATLRDALRIAKTLHEHSLVPSRAGAFMMIAAAQVKAGDVKDALSTADAVENVKDANQREHAADDKASVLGGIAVAQAETGDVKGALKAAEGIKQQFDIPSAKASALAGIALAQAKAGDRAGAELTFRQALESVGAFKQKIQTPDEKYVLGGFVKISMQHIAIARAKAGNFKGALETAMAIEADVDALREIAVLQAKAHDQAGARSTCAQALDVVSKIENPSWKISALVEIAKAQVEIGDGSGSGKTLEQALQTVAKVKDGVTGIAGIARLPNALAEIAAVQAMAGDIKGALKTADAIKEPEGFQKLAKALAEAGNAQPALEWASTQSSPDAQSRALLGIAEGILIRKGKESTRKAIPAR